MNFSTPDKVGSVINTMKNADELRKDNRATLNTFFNGDPPWTQKEAEENNVLINFNDKQGANLLHAARNQYENAFNKTGNLFKVTLPKAPKHQQATWGSVITANINKVIRDSSAFFYTQDCVWGGVVLHGSGVKIWWDQECWRPAFVGVQDILMPTDTELTMDGLRYFAVRRPMKPGELFRRTLAKGKNIRKGWNTRLVKKLLSDFRELNTNSNNYDWSSNPEQMAELYKQNLCYFDSDSAPVIWCWDFFHLEEENEDPNKNGWYKKIILDRYANYGVSTSGEDPAQFLYSPATPIARKLGEFIHFQFGDGNNVPPFKYHSIRSLAWLVYDLVWTLNRVNCQFTQHVIEQMMLLFRVQDPADRERLQKVVLQGLFGILPEGLNMVTAPERYQVNTDLVQGLQSSLKQQIGESSSQYTQAPDTGTQKERTKYEVQAILSQASALMATMLGRAYRQEHFSCLEICRRFTRKKSEDFDVKKFIQQCKDDGVPNEWIDSCRWEVEVEQVLGGGNRQLEIAEASQLMERVNLFDPQAQMEIKHDWVLAVTNNAKKAARLAPLDALPKVTDASHDAAQSFGTLMYGVQMEPKEGVNHIDQIETLLGLMQQVVQKIGQTDGIGTPQEVQGLQAVAAYVEKHIGLLAQDENEKERVKQYSDDLSNIMNEVRAFAQRQQEAAQKQQQQMDPATMAKLQADMAAMQQKMQMTEAKGQQQLRHKEEKFQQQQRHNETKATTDIKLQTGKALADTTLAGMKNGAKQNQFSE